MITDTKPPVNHCGVYRVGHVVWSVAASLRQRLGVLPCET